MLDALDPAGLVVGPEVTPCDLIQEPPTTMAPGQQATFIVFWSGRGFTGPLPPGDYLLRARVNVTPGGVAQSEPVPVHLLST